MELIREFISDLIARVIPGLVVIILYFHSQALAALTKYGMPSIICACIIGAAWGIGVVLENIVSAPYTIFVWLLNKINESKISSKWFCWLYLLRSLLKKRIGSKDFLSFLRELYHPKWLSAAQPSNQFHRFYLKHRAEGVLFRNVAVISFGTLFLFQPDLPQGLQWNNWLGWLGLILSSIFWFAAKVNGKVFNDSKIQPEV